MIVERNPTPMILVIVCTVAALALGLFAFSKNDERSEVPEQATAVSGTNVEPAAGNDLHPAANPQQ